LRCATTINSAAGYQFWLVSHNLFIVDSLPLHIKLLWGQQL